MTNETKHTPTPWDCADSENYSAIFGKGFKKPIATCDSYSKGFGPCKEERKANAAHIVKCVNMHDELVEALLRMKQWCEDEVGAELPCSSIDEALKKAEAQRAVAGSTRTRYPG